MVKTRSQRAVEARVLNDLRLVFKIDEIREAIFGQQGYDAVLLETRVNYEGKTDVERGEEKNCVYWSESMRICWQSVKDSKKFVLMMAREEIINEDMDVATGLLKAFGVVGHIGGNDKRKAVIKSLNCKLREEADIEEVLKKLQKLSKLARTNTADSHSGVEGINCKVSRKESFIDVVAWEGIKLEVVLNELEISRFKRVASKDDKVRRSQAKRRLVGKTPGSTKEKLTTSELNIPLKLARLNEIPDGPVDMAMVSRTVVRNLAKMKAVKRRAAPHYVPLVSMDDNSRWSWKKDLPARGGEKPVGREADSGESRFPVGAGERKGSCCPKTELRYTKAEIAAFSEGNYEEMEIMDEEEVEEREGGLNTPEKTNPDNQETINQKELDTAWEREEQTLLYNAEYAEEYEALISQYEDRLDDNVKLSLKLDEAKRQVKEKTTTILSRDLALNQLTRELAELKEKAASGSRHEAELAEYRIRALNEEISDMKCNIRSLNELLLKREIDLDTARTNLVMSEADFEKLSSNILGKDRELCNSEQIRDSLIAKLDRLKAELHRLKGKEAQSRADLVEIQAKNQNLVDDLANARENVRRATQCEKDMNERINQLCARISESERELRVRELKYQKDLKFELDKRDCEIASCEGSPEMKEFFRRKEELVENMRIDLVNSRQKLIDLIRWMSRRIDQLTAELAESKARRWKDNKRAAVTHQAFKELVVHEQEKYDGEVLYYRQLSALVPFIVEEIKFLQVERDLMQDCFSGRTCVCKLDISSIDPIGVMDRGIGTTMAEHIARG
ncbi:hypothetical protein GIB67_019088 [Kingdonia uniflora]|uniref:Uncharacterized protein n=1 Tax=Kingdonia uniflora TaxID=39325 RepID=A0A7J7MZE6_9MAGN|nr:hypothetical protein GIB67_019088 [Kingdonia uniflora]